jgi:hypothetical protein
MGAHNIHLNVRVVPIKLRAAFPAYGITDNYYFVDRWSYKVSRLPPPLEAEEADTLMQYMKLRGLKFTHIKNETGRALAGGKVRNWKAVWDARDGVSAGFPDFAVVLPHIGMVLIELKRLKGSNTSDAQLSWVEALNTCPGVEARVCKGADAAIAFIEELYPL